MSECIIEGNVEVNDFKRCVDALERHNELMAEQNEILDKIWRRM